MTLEEARTIWLTLLGSDWVGLVDVLESPYYFGTLDQAYLKLRRADELEINLNTSVMRIKCC